MKTTHSRLWKDIQDGKLRLSIHSQKMPQRYVEKKSPSRNSAKKRSMNSSSELNSKRICLSVYNDVLDSMREIGMAKYKNLFSSKLLQGFKVRLRLYLLMF